MTDFSAEDRERVIAFIDSLLATKPVRESTRRLLAAYEETRTERDAAVADAERYRWLRQQAYVLSSQHHDGMCAYEVQKEPVAMWIKTSIRSDDASVDAAIDAALAKEGWKCS